MRLKFLLKNKIAWVCILLAAIVIKMVSGYFSNTVETYTKSTIQNYCTKIINDGLNYALLEDLDSSSLFSEQYDSSGKVSYAYLDVKKVNNIRSSASKYMQVCVEEISKKENFDTLDVPLGYLFGSKYYFSSGLKVPIHIEVISDFVIDLGTEVMSEGINTTILEISLEVSVDVRMMIPFQAHEVSTSTKIPIALEIMNNEVPFYLGDIFN